MTFYIAPLNEGHTETACVERLLQRIWTELLAAPLRLQVLAATRGKRTGLVREGHSELAEKIEKCQAKLLRLLRHDAASRGLLLVLIDAEEDCPKKLAPQLLARAKAARSDADIACVLAKRELENWFKAAAASLAGVCGLPGDLEVPTDPEVGSGDTWLTRQMQLRDKGRKYTKPTDAVELASRMDLQQCRANAPSFDKLCRELQARLPQPLESDAGAGASLSEPEA